MSASPTESEDHIHHLLILFRTGPLCREEMPNVPYLSLLQKSLKNKASLKTNQQTFAAFPFAPQWRPSV